MLTGIFTQLTLLLITGIRADYPTKPVCDVGSFEAQMNAKVDKILSGMTLEEKVGQLTQININNLYDAKNDKLNTTQLDYYIKQRLAGSFLNNLADSTDLNAAVPATWVRVMNEIQDYIQKNTRLRIPMIYGLDSVHGANYIRGATLFPQQIGMGATFNRTAARVWGEITAKDTRAVGVHWNFSPLADIAVNKQWGRVYETFGEDPYVAGELGKQVVKGYQGENVCDLKRADKVAATMKHFIGYSSTKSGHDVDGSWMSKRVLDEYFVPPFQALVDSGVATAMESYSDIDGDHVAKSKKILVDLLRDQMGFKGALVTDYEQIFKLNFQHHVAKSLNDSLVMAMKLGTIDVSMVPHNGQFFDMMVSLVKSGRLPESTITKNAKRVLQLKYKMGLLDNNGQVDPNSDLIKTIGSAADRTASLNMARESVVLLENRNKALPLNPSSKVFVTGPCADSLNYLTGGWTFAWQGAGKDDFYEGRGTTIAQGLKNIGGSNVNYLPSVDINGKWFNNTSADQIVGAAAASDVNVVCLGETNYAEFIGNVDDMRLPEGQTDLVKLLSKSNKPLVLVLSQGRPRSFDNVVDLPSAILSSFLVGPEGGQAIAEIIYGKVNPSGKLPIVYTNKASLNTINNYRRFSDSYRVQWDFGHGLSYTTFNYTNLSLSSSQVQPNGSLEVSVTVTNNGTVAGAESILLYATQIYRTISPEFQRLRGFEKIYLNPNESKTVKFQILPKRDLSFIDVDDKRALEMGEFTVKVGGLTKNFNLTLTASPNNPTFLEAADHILV
ncbi:glycoside hydrolase family 3 protein [Conidiobolus coronatus NRRL 28638]|uniref:beta-glucosidase n=1 Tax=Conidiobolus coronatus (strain ATCC 28846 / CBS 209.66 / NRRL 28638) TaxID=796925 RepID=A0A137NZN8_CONC2|nr:glycoside hydrolase family 3 protein [Conidiobolus coronatus NRRL 28638]|eukprot:KXN68296.1 glycoside hydrolase family 3 protein [Conidiobolus coronatus NRRL 28638]